MKIYTYKKCQQTGDNLVSILENHQGFTAITFCDSKTFTTLKNAKNWLAKRGHTKVIEINDFN